MATERKGGVPEHLSKLRSHYVGEEILEQLAVKTEKKESNSKKKVNFELDDPVDDYVDPNTDVVMEQKEVA